MIWQNPARNVNATTDQAKAKPEQLFPGGPSEV